MKSKMTAIVGKKIPDMADCIYVVSSVWPVDAKGVRNSDFGGKIHWAVFTTAE